MALQNSSDTAVLLRTAPAAPGEAAATAAREEPRRPWWARSAQLVSHVANPPVVTAICVLAAAGGDGRPVALVSAGLFTLVGVVLPLVALVRQWRAGDITDLEVSRRHERLWPLLLTTTCVGSAAVLLLILGAPPAVAGLAAIIGVQSLALLAITGSWKISVHTCTVAAAGALCWHLTGRPEPGLVLVALMIWSRVVLRRHSPWQCLGGAALGASLMLVLWPLLAG